MLQLSAVSVFLALVGGSRVKKHSVFDACGVKGGSGASLMSTRNGKARKWNGRRGLNMSIVNGDAADECEWRWQVGLHIQVENAPKCGGMLISPEWVLTAAHCMFLPSWTVVAGDWKYREPSSNKQVRSMAYGFKHPLYKGNNFDFGLIKLKSPMEMGNCVGTVCLPEKGKDVQPETNCWISGWGTLRSGGKQADILMEAQVQTMSNWDCRMTGYSFFQIKKQMLCAQGRTADGKDIVDACQGDSGGPLVCEGADGRFTLYGATSWGESCASKTHPGVWARVHEALDWIDETMAAN